MNGHWQPAASVATLKLRARMLKRLRAFFDARDVLEVETPVLSRAATTEVHLHSFKTCTSPTSPDPLYLHTSPELAMKRLLAAGVGSLYQMCKVFRDGEAGARHNPEFTLVEWYRPGFALARLIDETVDLIKVLLKGHFSIQTVTRYTYSELFQSYLGIDALAASADQLAELFARHCDQHMDMPRESDHKDAWLDLLLTHLIEPKLPQRQLTVVSDYPASQASLARLKEDDPRVAQRFEVYVGPMELANGFNELTDPEEQRNRMQRDLHTRRQWGLERVPMDARFLAALEHGLPQCCGVAMGFDRLVMLAAGVDDIRQVLAFPVDRA